MRRGGWIGLGAAAAVGATGAGWVLQRRADRRAIAADPLRSRLDAPLEPDETLSVEGAGGTRLHTEVYGRAGAPTVVLLHGWTCVLRFWTLQIQALRGELRLVAYDLRGHGESEAPADDDFSTDALAGDLDAVLRATVPGGERPVLVGHSLGAMAIAAWAGANAGRVSERIAGAVLCNTGIDDLITESLLIKVPDSLRPVSDLVAPLVLGAKLPIPKGTSPLSHRAIRYIALSDTASPATVAFCEHMVLECRRDVRGGFGGTISRLDLREAVRALDVPTQVMAGAADRLTPPEHAHRLARDLPDCTGVEVVPRSGHMGPLEAPQAFDEAIRSAVAAGHTIAA